MNKPYRTTLKSVIVVAVVSRCSRQRRRRRRVVVVVVEPRFRLPLAPRGGTASSLPVS
jgi:hypothetical protein